MMEDPKLKKGKRGTGNAYVTKTCPRKSKNILDSPTTLKRESNMGFFRESSKTRHRMSKNTVHLGQRHLSKKSKDR